MTPPEILFGYNGWTLLALEDDGYWLEAPSGEGMRFSAERFQRLLEEFFDKEF